MNYTIKTGISLPQNEALFIVQPLNFWYITSVGSRIQPNPSAIEGVYKDEKLTPL